MQFCLWQPHVRIYELLYCCGKSLHNQSKSSVSCMEWRIFILDSATRENTWEQPPRSSHRNTHRHTLRYTPPHTHMHRGLLLVRDVIAFMIFHFPHTNKTHHTRTARVLDKLFFPTSVHSGYSIASFASSQLMHSQQDRWFIINTLDIFKFIMCVFDHG